MVDLTAVLNEDDDRLRGATIYDVQNELRRLKVLPPATTDFGGVIARGEQMLSVSRLTRD